MTAVLYRSAIAVELTIAIAELECVTGEVDRARRSPDDFEDNQLAPSP